MSAIRRLLVLLVTSLSVFVSLSAGAPAQAVQPYGASGQPGAITSYRVVGATDTSCFVPSCYQPRLQVPGPTIGRSPNGTAAQTLRIQYRIYRYNGASWVAYQTLNRNYSIGYTSSIRLQQETFNNNGGYFTVQMSMSWHLSSTGQALGTSSLNFNGNDYLCRTSAPCTASPNGYVHLAV